MHNPHNEYYVPTGFPTESPVQEWAPRETLANHLSKKDLKTLILYWLFTDDKFTLLDASERSDLWWCVDPEDKSTPMLFKDLARPNKLNGHPQVCHFV